MLMLMCGRFRRGHGGRCAGGSGCAMVMLRRGRRFLCLFIDFSLQDQRHGGDALHQREKKTGQQSAITAARTMLRNNDM